MSHTWIKAHYDLCDPRREDPVHFMKSARMSVNHKMTRFQFKKLVKRLVAKGYVRISVTVFKTNAEEAMREWVRTGTSVAKQVWSYDARTGEMACE